MAQKKTIRFVGGPLDGREREVDSDLKVYEDDEPGRPEDLRGGEVPVAFFPPFHKYVYEESADDRNVFVYKA